MPWRHALAAASGLALALAFPPFGLGFLVLVAPAGLLLAAWGAPPTTRATCGFLFGLGFFGPLLSWVREAGVHAWIALVLTQSLFPAAFALALGRARGSLGDALVASSLWVLVMDALHSRFPFGGFPWGSLGDPLVGTPLGAIAPLGGGIAVAMFAFVVASALALAARRRWRAAGLGLLVAAVAALLGVPFSPVSETGTRLNLAIVQGNVPLPPEPASPERTEEVLVDHIALTRTIRPGSVDLVIWPEGVVDLDAPRPSAGDPAPPPLADLARELDAWFVAGVVSGAGPGAFRNSALSITPEGVVAGAYDKQRPVPFGEYVPFRTYLGFVTALRAVPSDIIPGAGPRLVPVPGGRIGTPISYEVTFSRIVQGFAADGAEAIVVPTNTSSYGRNAATAEQQLLATRMRAREVGLWVIQSAPSGVSAIVDPNGRVAARTELYEAAILRGTIRLETADTPFARWGEIPVIVLAASAVILHGLCRRSRHSRHSQPT